MLFNPDVCGPMAGRLPLLALSNELLGTLGYIDRGDLAAAERIGHLRDESPKANWLRFHRPEQVFNTILGPQTRYSGGRHRVLACRSITRL